VYLLLFLHTFTHRFAILSQKENINHTVGVFLFAVGREGDLDEVLRSETEKH
jgi:hypothetical protein